MINSSDILRGKVLIVDDTPANVVLLEEMLKGTGYTSVKSTANPREVCALHRDNQFDLIMLDLQMPDMDGFHVMAGLKEVEPDGDLSVLVLTARPEHKILALKAGAKGFISKPFNLAEVLVQVHNLIEMRLLRRSADLLSASRLENSQRMAGLGDWDYDFTTNRSIWSDEIYRILGISREEFPPGSETFERMVHPDDKPPFLREKTAASQGNRCSNLEHRIVRPDGRIRHIHYVSEVISNGNGRPGHEAGTVQDITDRKLAEEDLRKSEERYRTMLMISPDAHVVLVGGVITFVNRAFCRLTGAAEPAQWIGRPVREVVHHDWHSYIEALVAQGPDEKRRPRAEIKFVRRDGTSVDVEVSNVVFDFRGRRELQLIARDITERKQLELHFRQANKMEALGRFSGGIAHDFNNIIMGISGYAELARLNLEGNETARAHIGAVLQAAHRAAELVRQILTFSRQQPQERLVIQLQPIIQECAKLLQGTIPSSVVFEVSVAADAPAVLAD
ncbi:MAG TPA: PAS domain S-box protein, partial [Opitutaceae bacterium]|nr:PAS domain S-box protein [Opitutaceae bacterium]